MLEALECVPLDHSCQSFLQPLSAFTDAPALNGLVMGGMTVPSPTVSATVRNHLLAMIASTFNPSSQGGRGRLMYEPKVSLVYIVSSNLVRAAQRDPLSPQGKKKDSSLVAPFPEGLCLS